MPRTYTRTYKGFGRYIIKGYVLSILMLLLLRFFPALERLLVIGVVVFGFVALPVWLTADARGLKPDEAYRLKKWRM
jgi:hypothetical protein